MNRTLDMEPLLGCYVFGVVAADCRLRAPLDVRLATGLRLVEGDGVAALVGSPPTDRELGDASDLLDHDRVLADLAVNGVAVVPLRFGTIVTDDDAVRDELLGSRRDELQRLLDVVRGRVQFTVTATYETDVVLRDVVRGNRDVQRLRRAADQGMQSRLALGERVVDLLFERRSGDAAAFAAELGPYVDRRDHPSADPVEILRTSVLVAIDDCGEFEEHLEEAARIRSRWARVRLVGPSPVYDFVGA